MWKERKVKVIVAFLPLPAGENFALTNGIQASFSYTSLIQLIPGEETYKGKKDHLLQRRKIWYGKKKEKAWKKESRPCIGYETFWEPWLKRMTLDASTLWWVLRVREMWQFLKWFKAFDSECSSYLAFSHEKRKELNCFSAICFTDGLLRLSPQASGGMSLRSEEAILALCQLYYHYNHHHYYD